MSQNKLGIGDKVRIVGCDYPVKFKSDQDYFDLYDRYNYHMGFEELVVGTEGFISFVGTYNGKSSYIITVLEDTELYRLRYFRREQLRKL